MARCSSVRRHKCEEGGRKKRARTSTGRHVGRPPSIFGAVRLCVDAAVDSLGARRVCACARATSSLATCARRRIANHAPSRRLLSWPTRPQEGDRSSSNDLCSMQRPLPVSGRRHARASNDRKLAEAPRTLRSRAAALRRAPAHRRRRAQRATAPSQTAHFDSRPISSRRDVESSRFSAPKRCRRSANVGSRLKGPIFRAPDVKRKQTFPVDSQAAAAAARESLQQRKISSPPMSQSIVYDGGIVRPATGGGGGGGSGGGSGSGSASRSSLRKKLAHKRLCRVSADFEASTIRLFACRNTPLLDSSPAPMIPTMSRSSTSTRQTSRLAAAVEV